MLNKEKVFSAIQPSGSLTIGNYIGAIKNWILMQNNYDCIFSVADLHTISVKQDPKIFYENIYNTYAIFLACGINLDKCIFFIQSHVCEHSQMSWVLSCFTHFGELSRMTQFKEKSNRFKDNVNIGLFTYPCLMAADILLYDTKFVPVGKDQKQHVEFARNIAERFNKIYSDTFTLPEPLIPEIGSKIMDLKDPSKKMSKSSPGGTINLLDSIDEINLKIKSAVTDSASDIKYNYDKLTGINNLISIYSIINNKTFKEIEKEFIDKSYSFFKKKLIESLIETLIPIQKNFNDYIKNKDYLEKCFKINKEKAQIRANLMLENVMKKIGFIF